jgi:thiosulfate reductase cytochrome b subunit
LAQHAGAAVFISARPGFLPGTRMPLISNKHPLSIRWFHWINFPVLAVMIWSGLLIYWANSIYRVGAGSHTLIHFFPEGFYNRLHVPFRLAEGMAWHFTFMWLFALNGLLYVLYTVFSGEWRYLLPDRRSLKDAWCVVLHDLHLRKALPAQRKYNGAQRIAYTLVVLMGAGSLVTGLAICKPTQLSWLAHTLGGYEWARWEHFWLTMGYVGFFLIHIMQVIRAGWNNFRSMVAGYEFIDSKPDAEANDATRQ